MRSSVTGTVPLLRVVDDVDDPICRVTSGYRSYSLGLAGDYFASCHNPTFPCRNFEHGDRKGFLSIAGNRQCLWSKKSMVNMKGLWT